MEVKQATPHHELIAQLLDSRIPKTEREHAAAREIERLRAALLQDLVDAPEPDGWRVVPLTATCDMRNAGRSHLTGMTSYADSTALKVYGAMLAAAPPVPSVPDGWRSAIAKEFPLYDEDGLDEDKHCCEWVMLQERKRLHKMLSAAPTPAEPPADLVRDAERWLSEHDLELLVTFGMQADDCDADGHTLSKEQTRRLCELGVLRNVGFGRHEMTAFGDSIFGVYFSQGISLPLQTHAEYNAAIERDKLKGGEA